ncbi:hypothetical protein AV530_002572 [Patagioenas fasciata monilis]|uniref:Uncharacterized protein n=1 Tax=Patagioenas fasciata monilis TaxID=372326 RepID=A0A1V4K6W2_PATFA|nr:hypothetical protein AV530_002572 [Patagioenas fasciata monilis]
MLFTWIRSSNCEMMGCSGALHNSLRNDAENKCCHFTVSGRSWCFIIWTYQAPKVELIYSKTGAHNHLVPHLANRFELYTVSFSSRFSSFINGNKEAALLCKLLYNPLDNELSMQRQRHQALKQGELHIDSFLAIVKSSHAHLPRNTSAISTEPKALGSEIVFTVSDQLTSIQRGQVSNSLLLCLANRAVN